MKKQTCSTRLLIAIVVCEVLVLAAKSAVAASLNYSDGDFGSNWTVTRVGSTGSVSGTRIASGGDPGPYWQVTNNVVTTDIAAISLCSAFSFNPSLSGNILDVTFSYDAITQINGQGQGTAPALMQNGVIYEVLPENSGYYGSWQPLSFAAMHADNFFALDGSGTHPNFTVTGANIVFGFANSNSGTGIYSNRTTQSDYDNFAMTINYAPVPEPGTCALLVTGIVAAAIRFSRKRSS